MFALLSGLRMTPFGRWGMGTRKGIGYSSQPLFDSLSGACRDAHTFCDDPQDSLTSRAKTLTGTPLSACRSGCQTVHMHLDETDPAPAHEERARRTAWEERVGCLTSLPAQCRFAAD